MFPKKILNCLPQTRLGSSLFVTKTLLSYLPMIGQRAQRILNPSHPAASSTSQSSIRAGEAKLSQQQRLSRWKSLVIKIQVMLNTFQMIDKAKLLLGKAVYLSIFQTAQNSTQTAAIQAPRAFHRVIGVEVVGKAMKPGEGKKDKARANTDPMMCQHDTSAMKPRSNGKMNWWL